ncbi:MAG: ATP-binding protein [Anaerolineae bacterium]|nr:ATP-binding protein [Anaerolineae bacterium]
MLDLLGGPGVEKFSAAQHLTSISTLFRHQLLQCEVEPPPASPLWLNQTLHVHESLIAWLRGNYEPSGVLSGCATLMAAAVTPTDHLLAVRSALDCEPKQCHAEQPLIALVGPDTMRQEATARLLAQAYGAPLLAIDLDKALRDKPEADLVIQSVLRDARLTEAVLCVRRIESCLDDEQQLPPDILTGLCEHPGVVVIASKERWRPGGIDRTRSVVWHTCGAPNYLERMEVWAHFLHGQDTGISADDLEGIAAQFALSSGKIRDAVALARDNAVSGELVVDDLYAAARICSNPRLSSLARKIEPRFGWEDIVLPGNQLAILHELIATVRHRGKVLEEWGVSEKLASSAGVTVLFAGPPGTGKTMAAEVIAHELGLDLYKIDLSSVVSKYIGETEKNLERIFGEAASSNAILFFDEADAIFGKRSEVKDAHDRYANIEVSYLLQRMERYEGITILATNLRANLDEAFTRRLQFVVDFPFPQAAERQRIWRTLMPPNLPCAADVDFHLLAQRFELSGGNIRNILVSAAYLAADNGQVVTMEHLLHGARRELQKMGRMVGESDFQAGRG